MTKKLISGTLVCMLSLPCGACDGDSRQVVGEEPETQRLVGRVRWLNVDKGVGFITGRQMAVYLHYSSVSDNKFGSLSEGDCVEFNLVEGPKGLAAGNVTKQLECPERIGDWEAMVERTRPVINCEPETEVKVGLGTTNSAFAQNVRKIISEQLAVELECLREGASFVDDLGADSLDAVELVMALEEEYDIEISDEDAEKLHTVGDVMRYLLDRSS